VRPARALPYELDARGTLDTQWASYRIDFSNSGEASAVFHVRSGNPADAPRSYTVEPGKSLSGKWRVSGTASTDYESFGVRAERLLPPRSRVARPAVQERTSRSRQATDAHGQRTHADCYQHVRADCHSACCRSVHRPWDAAGAEPGMPRPGIGSLSRSSGWYDFAVTVGSDPGLLVQLAGHLRTARTASAIRRWVVCGCGTSRRVRSPLARLQPGRGGWRYLLMKSRAKYRRSAP